MALEQSELDQIRASIAKIAETFNLDYWRKRDKTKEYPGDFKDALAAGGWLGIAMPEANTCTASWKAGCISFAEGSKFRSREAAGSRPTGVG